MDPDVYDLVYLKVEWSSFLDLAHGTVTPLSLALSALFYTFAAYVQSQPLYRCHISSIAMSFDLHSILCLPEPQKYAPAARHTAPFRLMDLPAELRNQIYELCLTPDRLMGVAPIAKPVRPSASLTRVNSQVRSETLSLYTEMSEDCITP